MISLERVKAMGSYVLLRTDMVHMCPMCFSRSSNCSLSEDNESTVNSFTINSGQATESRRFNGDWVTPGIAEPFAQAL